MENKDARLRQLDSGNLGGSAIRPHSGKKPAKKWRQKRVANHANAAKQANGGGQAAGGPRDGEAASVARAKANAAVNEAIDPALAVAGSTEGSFSSGLTRMVTAS